VDGYPHCVPHVSQRLAAADYQPHPPRKHRPARLNGTWLALILLSISIAQSFSGLAHYVNYTFPAASVLIALLLAWNRRMPDCLEFALWLWVTAPGLRRIVDWSSSFNEGSPILATPALVSLIVGFAIFKSSSRWTFFYIFVSLLAVLAGVYATLRGAMEYGPLPAAVAAILWFAPVVLGVTILADRPNSSGYVTALLRFSRWALLILSVYAIVQWVFAPAWDSLWLQHVTPTADYFGRPEPFQIRSFSLCSAPFVFAQVIVWMLLSQAGQTKSPIQWIGLVTGCVALGLSEVRAAWISLAVATIILVLYRKIKLTPLLVSIGVSAYLVVLFAAPVADVIVERFSTVQSAQSDESLLARVVIYEKNLQPLLSDVYGGGMGSAGSGLRVAGVSGQNQFANLDSSYLEILRTQGALFGTAMIVFIVAASLAAFRALPSKAPYSSWAALAVIIPLNMVLGNVTSGAVGVLTWVVIGVSAWRDPPSDVDAPRPHSWSPRC
jgi:O-Antigen ligase